MSFSRSLFVLCLCAATLSRAQTAPSPAPAAAPAHSHTPAAGSHGGGVVTLDQFVTTAAPFARNQVDLAQSTTVLSDRALLLKQQATLGDTLSAETGMHATSFGPGASRPIIRGLGGDRIRLLENGVGTLDASVASPDHAVSVEPFLVERVEILRGPASLLYGANAVGGVVNVLTHRIETDLPTEPVRGAVEARFGSGAEEWARGGVLDLALKPAADRAVVFHVDGFRRDADNVRIPGYAESARLRAEELEHAEEHGEDAPEFARDRLPNSSLESKSGAFGVSYVSPSFHLGASYSGLDTRYGVPGHEHAEHAHGEEEEAPAAPDIYEGTRIDLRQRRTDVQGEWHGGAGWVHGARFKFGHADYKHTEFEADGAAGTVFTNKGYDGRLELLHGDGKPWSGALGAQASRSDFAAQGDEAFLPPSRTDTKALFAFEEVETHPVTWQFGARYERTAIDAPGFSRRDGELAASVGAVWELDPAHVFAVSVAHTGRAPNAQELLADGAHAGTASYELGDRTLDAERSLGLEASLRRKAGFVTGALTVFTNRFDGYIFGEPTGLVAIDHDGWEFIPSDDPHAEAHPERLPVYRTVQRDARFWGVELETIWHLHESRGSQLDLRLVGDLTRARANGENLPRIPAARAIAGLAWTSGPWALGAECQFVFDQNRTAPAETASDGYTLLSAYLARRFELGRMNAELFARGANLTNDEARPHTSFVKDLAPLAGRSVTAGVRVRF